MGVAAPNICERRQSMTDILAKAINSIVEEQLSLNENMIKQNLLAEMEETDSYELIMTKLVRNSLHISVNISAQIIIDMLINSNIIAPAPDEDLRRILLSVVKD